jgi:hypothetical protein
MLYAAHQSELDTPDKDGVTRRALLTERVRKGIPGAQDVLDSGPQCPADLGYLYGYATELVGRSGVGMNGLAPLSYTTLRDWQALTGIALEPDEVTALMRLDSVIRNPPKETEVKPEPDTPRELPAWPEKKNA